MSETKWQVKVRDKQGKTTWTHLAYIPTELKERFIAATKHRGWGSGDWVDKWAMEDFGIKYIDTWDDIYALRAAIKAKYKALYPELHLEEQKGVIDKLGWAKSWTRGKMEEEIKRYEQR